MVKINLQKKSAINGHFPYSYYTVGLFLAELYLANHSTWQWLIYTGCEAFCQDKVC